MGNNRHWSGGMGEGEDRRMCAVGVKTVVTGSYLGVSEVEYPTDMPWKGADFMTQ